MKRSNAQTFKRWNVRISLRRELRFALLAAMETCWVYAILASVAGLIRVAHLVSPLSLFAAYWIALAAGRALPQLRQRRIVLQFLAIALALFTLLAIARVEFYSRFAWFDLTWLPSFLRTLAGLSGEFIAEYLATVGVLYMFIRGLGYAQRPLTLWFVSFQFRLGIVAFFLLLLLSGFLKPFDASLWIFVYFFVSLLAIALARIEEVGSDLPMGPRWAITLAAAVALVIFIGVGILQFLTLDTATALLRLFTPLWMVVEIVFLLIALPIGFAVSVLVELVRPLFKNLGNPLDALKGLFAFTGGLSALLPNPPALAFLAPLLKVLLTLTVILGVGLALARALNLHMQHAEEETFLRESIGDEDDAARARRLGAAKKTRPRRAAGPAAESIRRIYAALVARASDAGLPRARAETPYEYLPRLERAFPQQAVDVRAITDAYVAVHYGEREFAATEVERLRQVWRQVEKSLERSNVQTFKHQT